MIRVLIILPAECGTMRTSSLGFEYSSIRSVRSEWQTQQEYLMQSFGSSSWTLRKREVENRGQVFLVSICTSNRSTKNVNECLWFLGRSRSFIWGISTHQRWFVGCRVSEHWWVLDMNTVKKFLFLPCGLTRALGRKVPHRSKVKGRFILRVVYLRTDSLDSDTHVLADLNRLR